MATKLADAVAYLKTNDDELKKGLKASEGQVGGWGSAISGVLMGAGMAAFNAMAGAAQAAVGYMGDAVGAASDLGETVSKTGVLFGDATDSVLAWSENAATALGQSQQQALDAASTFATFGSAAGLAGDDLATFSTDFVTLASDLASFNNTSPEQAIDAIGAALRGESEPLRAYGVLLDDASMRQAALKLGLIETTKEALTPQQKVLAAQALIYEQTSAAQGDFARTSGGLANQQRILDAQMQNLQTTIGQALLPIVLALTTAMNNIVQAVLPPVTAFIQEQVVPAMNSIATAIQPVIDWIFSLGQSMQTQTDGPMAYMAAWWNENLPLMQEVADNVIGAITAFWNEFGDDITATLTTLFGWMQRFWDTQLKTLLDLVTVALQLLTGDWEGAGETLEGIVSRWWLFIREAFEAIWDTILDWYNSIDWLQLGRDIIQGIANGILGAAGLVHDAIMDAVGGSIDNLKRWLGIASPSQRAADEIGAPTAEGIAAGFRSSLEALQVDMAGGLAALMGGLAPAAPTTAGSVAGGGMMNVTINVYGADQSGAKAGVLDALRSVGWRG